MINVLKSAMFCINPVDVKNVMKKKLQKKEINFNVKSLFFHTQAQRL